VVLPDHIHAVLTLPPDDADFSTRWALIRAGFSRCIASIEKVNLSREAKGERGITTLLGAPDSRQERSRPPSDYIHINPVEHGHAAKASDWP